jgi:hypothetical protein
MLFVIKQSEWKKEKKESKCSASSGYYEPQTPQPPKYKSKSDCVMALMKERGIWGDLGLLAANGASFFDPTGISGIVLGVAQLKDFSNSTAVEGTVGGLSLTAGITNFGGNVRGIQVTETIVNRGSSITYGSTFWRGVPGLNKAFAAVSIAISAGSVGSKLYDINKDCNQYSQ